MNRYALFCQIFASVSVAFVATLTLSSCFTAADTEQKAEDAWKGIVKKQGWTPEIPPTTFPRPGLVYALLTDSSGNPYRHILCDDLTGGTAQIPFSTFPPTLNSDVEMGASVGVQLALKIAGKADNVGAKIDLSDSKKVTFTPEGARGFEMASLPPSGVRTIPSKCLGELKNTQIIGPDGKYSVPVYVVRQALTYGALKATFDGKSGPAISASIAGAAPVSANVDIHATDTGQGTLEFKAAPGESIYVGTHMTQIVSLQELPHIGAKTVAHIATRKPKFADVANIGELPFK